MTYRQPITPCTDTEPAPQSCGDDPLDLAGIPDFLRRPPKPAEPTGVSEHHALREIVERGDLAVLDGQTYLVAPVSPTTIDTLAVFEAEHEDREDEPVEAQGDDEPSIVSATWV